MKNTQLNLKLIARLTLVATLGGLLFGYDTAVISGAVGSLQAFFIDPLKDNSEQAIRILSSYRIIAMLVYLLIIAAVGGLFIRVYGKVKGGIFCGVLAIIWLVYGWSWWSEPLSYTPESANTLKGFLISCALVGCVLGAALAGFVSKEIGRKNGMIISAVLFFISALGSAIPEAMNFMGVEDITSFIVYRILGGIGVGLASMLSPVYIAEIAPAGLRGKLVSWYQFAIIFGMIVVYFVNYFIALQGDDIWLNSVGWRWMFASETIPAFLFFVLLFLVPETPRYFAMKNMSDRAKFLLERLNGKEQAERELQNINESLKVRSAPWLSFGGLVLLIGIMLCFFQQFVGINVVLYYAPEIFKNMGNATDASLLLTVIVGAINLSATLVAVYRVDRWGRKPLLISGALGMAVCMVGLGLCFYLEQAGMLALIFILIYTASFAISWGPVTWVVISEIFPNSIRGAMSIAVATQWVSNLVVSWTFPMLNDNAWLTETFNHGFAYWIYGAVSFVAAWFVWKVVPETKGMSLETVEDLWKRR